MIDDYRKIIEGFEQIIQEYDENGPQDILLVKSYGEFNFKLIIHSPEGGFTMSVEKVRTILCKLREIEDLV